jgi:hypothetical protein
LRAWRPPAAVSLLDIQHVFFPEFFSRAELAYRRLVYDGSLRRAGTVIAISATRSESGGHGGSKLPASRRGRLQPGVDLDDSAALLDRSFLHETKELLKRVVHGFLSTRSVPRSQANKQNQGRFSNN